MAEPTTAERTLDSLLALLPRGRAFSRKPGSWVHTLLDGFAQELSRIADETEMVVRNCLPTDALELLDEWEEALGLPDDCSMPIEPAEHEARRLRIIEKLRGRESFSPAAWIDFLAAHGWEHAEEPLRFEPFRAGAGRIGDRLFGDDWSSTLRLIIAETGEPALTLEQMRCALNARMKRAHTFLLINDAMNLDADPNPE